MSSDTAEPAARRDQFDVVRGRGYRPEQVDRFLDELSEDRDAAWERAARLTVLANEMDAECAAVRVQVEALGAAVFDRLGPGALELLRLVEEEAAAVRDRAEAEAQYARDAAETARRALQDEARMAATARVRGADQEAEQVLEAACTQAADILAQAQAEADAVRGEAEQHYEAMRRHVTGELAEMDAQQRRRVEELEREVAERQAGMDSGFAGLLADAGRRLQAAQREHTEAEESLRAQQAEAEARASAMLAQARVHEERTRREAERALRAHEQHRDDIRAHLAHIRATLGQLTGRTQLPADDPLPDPDPGQDHPDTP
jgi:DivIVA domain-containing protein